MYIVKIAVWIIIVTLTESVLGTYIKINTIMPDLLFTFALCFAAQRPKMTDVVCVGVICGVIADCLSGRIFGNYTAIFLISVVLLFIVRENFFRCGFLFNTILVFLLTVIGKSMFYVVNIFILKDVGYLYSLFFIILPEAVYNTVVSFVLFFAIRHSFKGKAVRRY